MNANKLIKVAAALGVMASLPSYAEPKNVPELMRTFAGAEVKTLGD